jgi:gas vesicle protein
MARRTISTVNYFLAGLGIGSLIGILYAPKSGVKTREDLAKRASGGNEYVYRKPHDLKVRAEELVERGKKMITKTKGQIAAAIDLGRETYHRERSKAHIGWTESQLIEDWNPGRRGLNGRCPGVKLRLAVSG